MEKIGPKSIACKFASIFGCISTLLTILCISFPLVFTFKNYDIVITICVVFWVFTFLCLAISCTAPKNKPKVNPIELI